MSQKEYFVDLHIHTCFSDGIFTPEQVVEYSSRVGLSAISITDHDTVDGVQRAVEAGKKYGVEIISGIELSAELDNVTKTEMHILGYYVNWKSKSFNDALAVFKKVRIQRAKSIFEKLKDLNIELEPEGLVPAETVPVFPLLPLLVSL